MIVASEETLSEIINEYGTDFGFIPMQSVYGDVLAGEMVLTKVPLPCGLDIIDDINLDITAISGSYTIFDLFRCRKDKEGRKRAVAAQVEQLKKNLDDAVRAETKDEILDYARYLGRKG
jgi:hypothetical protein